MRNLILFTASSMDGFIAGPDNGIDWLFTDGDYGYKEFYNSIDTTLSGNNTYKVTLSFGEFPYTDKENFVFTRNPEHEDTKYVKFVRGDITSFVRKLKQKEGKDIWLVGGGQINTLLLNENLIDRIVLSVHPVVIGKGIPLFGENAERKKFMTKSCESFPSGLVQIELVE